MKRLISIFLLLLFVSNSLFKAAVIFDYWHHKQAIIEDCCINKNKPELQCEGKCYVSKKMDDIDRSTQQELPSKLMQKDFELQVPELLHFIPLEFASQLNHSSIATSDYCFVYVCDIFQPPTPGIV